MSCYDNSYYELILDLKSVFTNGNISIIDGDGGTTYIFEVTCYSDDEYKSYIYKCKKKGFNDISYDTVLSSACILMTVNIGLKSVCITQKYHLCDMPRK